MFLCRFYVNTVQKPKPERPFLTLVIQDVKKMVVDVSKRCRRWCKASILTHMLMLMVTLVLMVCPAVAEIQCESQLFGRLCSVV